MEESGVEAGKVRRVAIGGNTTMGHLLMGYDCDTLGVYPFTPVNIDFIEGSFQEIWAMTFWMPVQFFSPEFPPMWAEISYPVF